MKLFIEIEFGNEAMQRYSQARSCIKDALGTSDHRSKPALGDGGFFHDRNGTIVGTWNVSDRTVPARNQTLLSSSAMFASLKHR